MTGIKYPIEVVNCTAPKVIANREVIGIYLTRAATPYPKGSLDFTMVVVDAPNDLEKVWNNIKSLWDAAQAT